ncbi:MAG: type IV pilus secretin PilQ [Methylophilaceae bacterium]
MKIQWLSKTLHTCLFIGLMMLINAAHAENQAGLTNKITNVDFSSLPGGRVVVRIKTQEPLANPPAGFSLTNPARIALDFPKVASGIAQNNIEAGQGALKNITMVKIKDRTRMVLNLAKNVGYETALEGNEVKVTLQANEASTGNQVETKFAEATLGAQQNALKNVDFARGKNGEGRIIVDLSDPNTGINIKEKGKTIVVDFTNTAVPEKLQRRLNVTNFNTPVVYVDTTKQGNNARLVIEPKGNWEHSAYQTDKKFIIDVRQVVEDPNKLVRGSKPGYSGEKLSLNFQNIEVRSVLQVIADFTGLNIITSDTVSGNLTLRLKDVPWDQALDIITQSKGLAMRKTGNVILIAPAEEVSAKEKQALEASQQIDDLEPLRTEVYTLKYMKADALKTILTDAKQKILSKRGSAVLDPRTNTVFVQDTPRYLEQVQSIINKTDIPVKQVMIESRIVIADDKFGKSLGARFGVNKLNGTGDNRYAIGSNVDSTSQIGVAGGVVSQGLQSNLPVAGALGQFALSIFRLPAGLILNLELSAMETDHRGKIVSSPRVTTANQHQARVAQGVEIPYKEASSSGAATVSFKKAELSLEVTPQITPDDKVIMDLEVRKDSRGEATDAGPAINTQSVQTQVLVANGETAVLGGIFEQNQRNDVDKVPFFGDIPVMGNLFKRRATIEDKTELLIFVTPKIMDESLSLR